MIRNPDADFGDEFRRAHDKRIKDEYDQYKFNSQRKVNAATINKQIKSCIRYCGMENRNTNYIEVEPEHGNKRKCWCYIIPGRQNHFLSAF